MDQKGVSTLIIISAIALIILGFFLYSKTKNSSPTQQVSGPTIPNDTEMASILNSTSYMKQRFYPDDEILRTYPPLQEFLKNNSHDLTGMDCKNFQSYSASLEIQDFTYYDQPSSQHISLDVNEEYKRTFDLLKSELKKDPQHIVFCKTEDNRLFAVYGLATTKYTGGGNGNDSFVVEVKDNKVINLAKIPAKGIAYYSCTFPFMLKENNLYILCGGGDGGCTPRAADFYRINTVTKTFSSAVSCQNIPNDACQYNVSCQ